MKLSVLLATSLVFAMGCSKSHTAPRGGTDASADGDVVGDGGVNDGGDGGADSGVDTSWKGYVPSPAILLSSSNACAVAGYQTLAPDVDRDPTKLFEVDLSAVAGLKFFGQPVTKMWVSPRGYVAFTETAPALPVDRFALDHAAVPPGIYPLWEDLKYPLFTESKICFAETPTGLVVTWSNMCFGGDGEALGCVLGEDRLRFSVTLDKVAGGDVHITYLNAHGSSVNAARALHGGASEGSMPTIGLRGFEAAHCPLALCDAVGLCATDGKPCGYNDVPDPSTYFLDDIDNSTEYINGDLSIRFRPR